MERLELWPGDAWSDEATLSVMPCSSGEAVGNAGVLVLPGGGYNHCAPHEGEPVAERFAAHGLHGAALIYRHAPNHHHPVPAYDALRAVRVLRRHGWSKVAVLGFSAGGHLAATTAVHYDRFVSPDDDLADAHSARPDAVALCYAVVDLEGAGAHTGSRRSLLTADADDELIRLMSLHNHVTAQTPPTFLWHTADDGSVPLDNALLMTRACRAADVPVELHVYEHGPHGVGLADGTMGRYEDASLATWFGHATTFLHRHLAD